MKFVIGTLAAIGYLTVPSLQSNNVIIHTYNPYTFRVRVELKCDIIPGTNRYKFYQNYFIPGDSKVEIAVPSNLRVCEIWPKVLF
jgi:hypothetical protein